MSVFKSCKLRWWLVGILSLEFILLIWAFFHQFIPSIFWQSLAFKLNIGISLATVACFAYLFWQNPNSLNQRYSPFKKWLVIISVPIFFYGLGYLAILYGLGAMSSQYLGTPHVFYDVLEKHYVDSPKSCKTRLISSTLDQAFPKFFCVSVDQFETLPAYVSVNFHGKQHLLGFYIESIEYDWLKTSFLPKTKLN